MLRSPKNDESIENVVRQPKVSPWFKLAKAILAPGNDYKKIIELSKRHWSLNSKLAKYPHKEVRAASYLRKKSEHKEVPIVLEEKKKKKSP